MKRTMLALALVAAGAFGAQAQVSQRLDDDDIDAPARRAEELRSPRALDREDLRADRRDLDPRARAGDEDDQVDLAARIEDGERDGRLTRSEAADLKEDLAQLEDYQDRDRQGRLSREERRHMEDMRAELSRRIDDSAEGGESRYGYRAAPDEPRSERRYDRR